MLTKLLAPKGQRTAAPPLIQVIGNVWDVLSFVKTKWELQVKFKFDPFVQMIESIYCKPIYVILRSIYFRDIREAEIFV